MTLLQRLTYTVEETGDLIGISRGSAYNLVRTGEIPALRMGRRLLVSRVALEKLLGSAPPPPADLPQERSPVRALETAPGRRARAGTTVRSAAATTSARTLARMATRPNADESAGHISGTARVRPVAVVEDLDDDGPKAAGRIDLPLHIAWSDPRRTYDLSRRYDRRRVYEQVLSEGTPDDVRYYIRASDLLDLWDDLVLPAYVRQAWQPVIERRRGS